MSKISECKLRSDIFVKKSQILSQQQSKPDAIPLFPFIIRKQIAYNGQSLCAITVDDRIIVFKIF